MRVASIALLLTIAVVGCADKASEKQCRDLLDHTIELEYAENPPGMSQPGAKEAAEKEKQELRAYIEKDFMDQCLNELPKNRVVCGLAAKTKAEQIACDEDKEESVSGTGPAAGPRRPLR